MAATAEPVRTCVACRQEGGKQDLVRFRRSADGKVERDPVGAAGGRGAYLHPTPVCLEMARRRHSLERALKAQLPDGFWEPFPGKRP